MKRSDNAQRLPADAASYLDLAGEAVLAGMTREQVVTQLVSRIRRDHNYIAYRKACNRRTRYDGQVLADMRALALAAVLLGEEGTVQRPLTLTSRSSRTSGISRAASA
jgi:hypothetical protein